MDTARLESTAAAMVAPGKGILAADESAPTIKKRFDSIGVECTADNRRDYRELLFTAPGIDEQIAGVILFDETLRQDGADGRPLRDALAARGIMPGIKVDGGAKELAGHAGEKVTEGLDGLRDRLAEYAELGAPFAKWRAVIRIDGHLPSRACIAANAHALARYAALCQEAGLVPMVEPEVLLDGSHTIERCFRSTEATLRATFDALHEQGVHLEGTILKASMVLSGKNCAERAGVEEVARETVRCLLRTVPAALAGVVFLSGGQTPGEATAHLDAMNRLDARLPWPLSFSYSRALQEPALAAWGGDAANGQAVQRALAHRARMNGAAARGAYDPSMEDSGAA